tara:strand:+ start:203 stop:400 length:198 start_codon:yes stop_codon:yes gene_type:complete
MHLQKGRYTIRARPMLSPYPETDFRIVFPKVLDFVTKTVKTMKVVETGILILVRISKIIGAAVCR